MKKQHLIIAGLVVAGAIVISQVVGTQKAAALSDNVWWGHCNGRYKVRSGSIKTRGKTTGTVTVYGCSNGYYFTHTKRTTKGWAYALIERRNKHPYRLRPTSVNSTYIATTNMLKKVKGACYYAVGSNGQAISFSFCVK